MGYVKPEHVIAVLNLDFPENREVLASLNALREDMPDEFRPLLMLAKSAVENYFTVCFAWDGSKEGWEHSLEGDRWREEVMGILRGGKYVEMVHLQMGGDDKETIIMSTTDRRIRLKGLRG